MRLVLVLCFMLLGIRPSLDAAPIRYDFNPDVQDAYQLILSLRLAEAAPLIKRLQKDDPNNFIFYLLEDYIDFFTIYVSEDKETYRNLKANRDRRLEILEVGDESSPYYLYCRAEIHLHWALLRLRFEDYFGAFNDINRANKLLKRNQKLFPHFVANLKDLGVLHAAVSTIPDNLRWGVELLSSLEGDLSLGMSELETVMEYAQTHPDFPFADETKAIYAFVLMHLEGKPEEAWRSIQRAGFQTTVNPLHCFVVANIAMRSGHNDEALRYLEARPRGQEFISFPYLDYMLGICNLRKLNATKAKPYFERFLSSWRGEHFRKEAWQKLAWCELIQGNESGYQAYILNVSKEKRSAAGGDKNANREAMDKQIPQVDLLRARLLFDGAYFERGRNTLVKMDQSQLSTDRDQIEYIYRMGRLLHGEGLALAALEYYREAIEKGRNLPYFFACNAALQAGLIYEEKGDKSKAKYYLEECLNIKPDAYRTGLHQQAKAALARLK